jgi:hypothetical protein
MCSQSAGAFRVLDELYSQHGAGRRTLNNKEMGKALRKIVEAIPHTYIILNALDECPERDELLDFLREMAGWKLDQLHILVLSRPLTDIDEAMDSVAARRVALQSQLVDPDIETYVRTRLRVDKAFKWPSNVQGEIEKCLTKEAGGMYGKWPYFFCTSCSRCRLWFCTKCTETVLSRWCRLRWAYCQLDALHRCRTTYQVRQTLRSLPKTLDETYDRILAGISETNREYVFRALQWLAFSARPVSVKEVAEAMIIDIDCDLPHVDHDRALRDPRDLRDICTSLVKLSRDGEYGVGDPKVLELAHFSVKEYLMSSRIRDGPSAGFSLQ